MWDFSFALSPPLASTGKIFPLYSCVAVGMLIDAMSANKKIIPNSLRKFRRLMGYSQADVMRLLGLKSTSMISRWENGQSMPSAEYLLKLSILYKTLVNELYYELGREYQVNLFPPETDVNPVKKRKDIRRSDRGP